jgi:tripeptide aminopeptidase
LAANLRRASDGERERLHATFAALCAIPSPSGDERACADHLTAELRSLGLEVDEDDAARSVGSNAGNLYTLIPGTGARSLMLCAHIDTVPPTAPLEPVLVDGGWENAGEGILGADNKAAVAVMLELARRLLAPGAPEPAVGLELVFTVSEENGLNGAKAFDAARLRSEFGYVFDHATPVGEIVGASPTYHRITAELRGRSAHAGLEPELGRSAIVAAARAIAAMELGRLDPETTANVGIISGGTATNVVPERCHLVGEVRGLDERRVEEAATALIDHLQDGADGTECDLDVIVERVFKGYRLTAKDPLVEHAGRALRSCGYAPSVVASGGGSDANVFLDAGFRCANLANGTERAHQPTERVSVDALEGMFEVAIALLDQEAGDGT